MHSTRAFRAVASRRLSLAHRTSRAALLVALAAVPLSQSAAQQAAPALDTATPFASHFTEVVAPLGTDEQGIELALPGDAVDLDSFEPPVEAAPIGTSLGSGVASYYGRQFHGRRTASGETFDMHAFTAAHRTLPFGSMVRLTNPSNGRSVTVRINDRGPFSRGRTIDVSRAAAEELGLIARGHGTVELELLEG